MLSLTDEQLMDIYQENKDGQGYIAFDHLYNRYAKKLLSFFYFSLKNDYYKAQDFVQDLFVKIIENHQRFDKNQFFKPWIYRIASNMCKNDFRSRNVYLKYKNYILSTSESVILINEKDEILRKCIDKLDPEQRSLIVLRYKLKLTVKEIAEIYECPEGTIKSRLFYSIKELSKLYKQ